MYVWMHTYAHTYSISCPLYTYTQMSILRSNEILFNCHHNKVWIGFWFSALRAGLLCRCKGAMKLLGLWHGSCIWSQHSKVCLNTNAPSLTRVLKPSGQGEFPYLRRIMYRFTGTELSIQCGAWLCCYSIQSAWVTGSEPGLLPVIAIQLLFECGLINISCVVGTIVSVWETVKQQLACRAAAVS